MIHTEKWFLSKVGKRIFRDEDTCQCRTCQEVVKNWLIVHNEQHARHLYDVQNDFWAEWINMNYRSKK